MENQESCHQDCQSTDGCKWFTLFKTTSICLLMADCKAINETCSECVYGEACCNVEEEGEQFQKVF